LCPESNARRPIQSRIVDGTRLAKTAVKEQAMCQTTTPESVQTDVLVVGAGPTGLTLAAALMTRRVRVLVIDRLPQGANTSRAAVVHARTLEALETLGVAEQLVLLGIQARRFTIRDRDRVLVPIGFEKLPTRYPFALMVSQAVTERVLLERFVELGGQIVRPRAFADLAQHADAVVATLDDGSTICARYLVGADGMHSMVRERAGIAFSGGSYDESFSLADVRLTGGVLSDEVILYFSQAGILVLAPLPGNIHRLVATVDEAPEQPSAADVQALLDARGPQHQRALVHEVI
jgi:2-polyprenyl-6-methoxyphenol hydroxylase-like FAD-dependent oxidoreductase